MTTRSFSARRVPRKIFTRVFPVRQGTQGRRYPAPFRPPWRRRHQLGSYGSISLRANRPAGQRLCFGDFAVSSGGAVIGGISMLGWAMSSDVIDLRDFYRTGLGQVVRRMIRRAIQRVWPELRGMRLLGVGYATPFLTAISPETERTVALT